MIVGLKESIPYVINKSSREIQLMLPGLKMNYLNTLMFCINVILMSVQLFVMSVQLFVMSVQLILMSVQLILMSVQLILMSVQLFEIIMSLFYQRLKICSLKSTAIILERSSSNLVKLRTRSLQLY